MAIWKTAFSARRAGPAMLALVAACTGQSGATSNGGPTAVCGHVLVASAVVPAVADATSPAGGPITATFVDGLIYLKVTKNCGHGSDVTWTPRGLATLDRVALAKDGKLAAVVLRPRQPRAGFVVKVTQADGQVTLTRVALA